MAGRMIKIEIEERIEKKNIIVDGILEAFGYIKGMSATIRFRIFVSPLFHKNMNFKMHSTIILPVVCWVCNFVSHIKGRTFVG
jgi:hypothetical protein